MLSEFVLRDVRGGALNMTLAAEQADVFEERRYADVDAPHIVFFRDGKPTSRMEAPEGRVFLDTHAVEAWGGVEVVTQDSATLTTERLRYDPETRKIYSQDPVTLRRPGSTTRGEGLESDPELTRVKIKRQRAVFSEEEPS